MLDNFLSSINARIVHERINVLHRVTVLDWIEAEQDLVSGDLADLGLLWVDELGDECSNVITPAPTVFDHHVLVDRAQAAPECHQP